ncbi:MAG: YggT family protein [Holosporaceae bacterium]|nr:YggT family protein [Holosporaceae bacterium]
MDIVLVPFLIVLKMLVNFTTGVVLVSVLLGWLVVADILSTNNKLIYYIIDALSKISNFILNPIRRRLKAVSPSFDIAPLVLVTCLVFVELVIARILARFCIL